ncbi:MAG: formate/nitrite transporter family protein [Acidocella sp.]|nr:formate/nitrite transporter family protein [Acidocella sp.]
MTDMDDGSLHDMSEGSAHLDGAERELAARHTAPRALIIHEIIRDEGEQELSRTVTALALSGLAAGLSMGFSFLTEALLQSGLPQSDWRGIVTPLGYSVGFILVVLARQQLFTESTLTAVLPVITRRDGKTLRAAARLWAVVLVANLLGTWIFAAFIHLPGIFSDGVNHALGDIASQAIPPSFFPTMARAFLAGWLIALMVWILPSANAARLLTIMLVTYVVALAHLSHIVAGSAEAAYSVLAGHASMAQYGALFLVPTLLGNILGGVLMVTVLNHGAVVSEIKSE